MYKSQISEEGLRWQRPTLKQLSRGNGRSSGAGRSPDSASVRVILAPLAAIIVGTFMAIPI